MVQMLKGVTPYREEDAELYIRRGWWPGLTLGDYLDRAADVHPDKEAFVDSQSRLTFGQAREKADKLAIGLMALGIQPTEENRIQLERRSPDPMQVAHMGPTGGTTGTPKIVPRTHSSLACGIGYCSTSWEQHCEDINLIVGPVGHDLSFGKGFIGSVITQGKLVLLDSTDNSDICKTIEKEKITGVNKLDKKALRAEIEKKLENETA